MLKLFHLLIKLHRLYFLCVGIADVSQAKRRADRAIIMEEERRATLELKSIIMASREKRGQGEMAQLPRRPVQTLEELFRLCEDLQRMPAFRVRMVRD